MIDIVRQVGSNSAAVAALFTIFGIFWNRNSNDTSIDTEYAAQKLADGLNGLSDADGRNTGEGQYVDPNISLADAQLAYSLRLALDPQERATNRKR